MKTDKQGRSYNPGVVDRLSGRRFGALTVVQRGGNTGKFAAWLCHCDCGAEVVVGGDKLRRGRRKACGVNGHRWKSAQPRTQNGLTTKYKSEYQSWENMRKRCRDSKHKNFPNYGARGITICARWESFHNFMLDMGKKPDPKFTIERKDVNGNYEPDNCVWTSKKDQHRNRRNSVLVTYQGKKIWLTDLVKELGLSRNIVYQRLKLGWSLETAIALPVRGKK